MNAIVDHKLGDKDKEIQTLKEQVARMEAVQTKIMYLVTNRKFPQSVLGH